MIFLFEWVVDEDESIRHLTSILAEFGGWPMTSRHWTGKGLFNWRNMLADVIRDLAVSPLVNIYVYVDRKESNKSILTVSM